MWYTRGLSLRAYVHVVLHSACYVRTKLLVTTQTRYISVLCVRMDALVIYIEPGDSRLFYDTQFHDESSWVSSTNDTMCLISKGLALC